MSQVSWIATANSIEELSDPLLNRFTIIEVKKPDNAHFDNILESIKRKFAEEFNIPENNVPDLDPDAKSLLRNAFKNGFSVRTIKNAYRAAMSNSINSFQHVRH